MDYTFFDLYFKYVVQEVNKEVNPCANRWCSISVLATILGRRAVLPFGSSILLPNQYIQLIGGSATRKSTAIKNARRLLEGFNFTNFAAEKTSLSQFLVDLHELTWKGYEDLDEGNYNIPKQIKLNSSTGTNFDIMDLDDITDDVRQLDGRAIRRTIDYDKQKKIAADLNIAECCIANDEFVDFIGRNNLDFISLLGTFWDYNSVYDYKLKHSAPVFINNPTINILSGNTHMGFNKAFPVDIQDQGFFSRLLMINVRATGYKVAIPEAPKEDDVKALLTLMADITTHVRGTFKLAKQAHEVYSYIYFNSIPLEDSRFESYNGRRGTHLLKLSMLMAASRVSLEINIDDVILANTLLTFAEVNMPAALGEFGRSKNSTVAQKVLNIINNATVPIKPIELSKLVYSDLDNIAMLKNIVDSLIAANKVKLLPEGLFSVKAATTIKDSDYIKPSLLLDDERYLN